MWDWYSIKGYKMKVILVRHGMTIGNTQKKYIGTTDESLCEAGIHALQEYVRQGLYPSADRLFVSPMRRCVETAKLLYPALSPVMIDDFRECDFGAFEGKNYLDLAEDEAYQHWIDSNGTLPFPGGEAVNAFKRRCVVAFRQCVEAVIGAGDMRSDRRSSAEDTIGSDASVVVVAHGGTIMAIMEHYAEPRKDYYDYQVTNGLGYVAEYKEGRLCDVNVLGNVQD